MPTLNFKGKPFVVATTQVNVITDCVSDGKPSFV